jgi:CubicO group peptidase (beta-lactamase class C family)
MPSLLLALALLSLDPPGSAAAGLGPELRAAIEREVAAAEQRGFRGQVAVRLEQESPLVMVAGSADLEGRVPVTLSTQFQVASITKYITAAAVLRLVESRKLGLDEPIGRHVPGLPAGHAELRIRELLAHTSGLPNAYAAEGISDRDRAIAALGAVELDPRARGTFRYTNDGYELLALAVELVSGEPYERFVHRELLERAGGPAIRYWTETDVSDPRQIATCLRTISPPLRRRNYGVLGSAALVATADALIDWQLAVWGGRVISAAMRDEMFTERLPVSLGSVGYGVFIDHDEGRGLRLLARGYEDWGANAVLSHWPEAGVVVAVVTSSGPAEETGHPGWSRELTSTVSDLIFGTGR